jgi:N-acetylglucosaminyl-diphospho-decaprenol L-rhamnosyltransferase
VAQRHGLTAAPDASAPVHRPDGPPSYDIVVVTHNSAECVVRCLEAADTFFARRYAHFIIVDNASSDGSSALASRAIPEARVVQSDRNVGFAAAVNKAVAAGGGDWVVLLNPDVSRIDGAIEAVEAVAQEATRVTDAAGVLTRTCHAAATPFTMLSESLSLHERFPRWRRAISYRMLDWDMASPRDVEDACGAVLFLRRSALEEVGQFDERFFLYFEETDWLLRARSEGWRVLFTPQVEVVHLSGRSSGESREALSAHYLRSQYKYLRKHFGPAWETVMRVAFSFIDATRWAAGLAGGERRLESRRAANRLRIDFGLGQKHD